MKAVKLGDICELITRGISPKYTEDEKLGVTVLNQKCIRNKAVLYEFGRLHSLSVKSVNESKFVKSGDVLVNSTGHGTLGRTALAENVDKPLLVDSHVTILRPVEGLFEPRYFAYLIGQSENDFIDMATGTSGQTELPRALLNEYKVSYEPSLEEQRRIVARLDAAFEKISAAEVLTRQNLDNATALQKSILHKYLSTSDTTSKLADVCQEIFAGGDVVKSRTSKTITEKFTVPVYTNGEKNNGLYGFTDMIRVNKPSVTVSARGTIGFSAVRKEPFYPAVRLIVLTPDTSKLDVEYLDYAIKTLTIDNTGTSIPQLTVPMIKEYSVSLPSIDTQRKIVGILNTANEKISKLELKYTEKLTKLAGLRQSLLAEAFSTTNTV